MYGREGGESLGVNYDWDDAIINNLSYIVYGFFILVKKVYAPQPYMSVTTSVSSFLSSRFHLPQYNTSQSLIPTPIAYIDVWAGQSGGFRSFETQSGHGNGVDYPSGRHARLHGPRVLLHPQSHHQKRRLQVGTRLAYGWHAVANFVVGMRLGGRGEEGTCVQHLFWRQG